MLIFGDKLPNVINDGLRMLRNLRAMATSATSDLSRELGTDIQWVESYVTDDKLYCVYLSPDEDLIRQHAQRGGFPADRISRVKAGISPLTAEKS